MTQTFGTVDWPVLWRRAVWISFPWFPIMSSSRAWKNSRLNFVNFSTKKWFFSQFIDQRLFRIDLLGNFLFIKSLENSFLRQFFARNSLKLIFWRNFFLETQLSTAYLKLNVFAVEEFLDSFAIWTVGLGENGDQVVVDQLVDDVRRGLLVAIFVSQRTHPGLEIRVKVRSFLFWENILIRCQNDVV